MLRFLILIGLLSTLVVAGCDKSPPPSSATTPTGPKAATKTITVFAAASTTDVLRAIGTAYESKVPVKVAMSFDSSSNLAKQIKAGAPADLFISADSKWMDDVAAAGAIRAESRSDLLGNELVLVASIGKRFQVTFTKEFDFAGSLPQIQRIAVGDPSHVPAGRYAKQALEKLGWWSLLEKRLVPGQDVRAALRLVELGEADAGIVYSTDAKASAKVTLIGVFPAETHEPIVYPAALCGNATPEARAFLEYLRSTDAKRVFEGAGFRVFSSTAAATPAPMR